ncbi:acyl carrier protein [Pseudomonas sp. ABC1]|uniref:phosphopantetheine-binding protein n=1 Tax=Pseudomonas sp. ABC1 TaxID=2748080 RepID=UPI0015C35B14|nr:phosphopantetheine-binding protein [Pseudomonas sp. ABC1]QLF94926.1 acyl carrier protein [Pseudomonas sp. ABC1]
MGAARNAVVQDFIVSNGKIAQGYFDLSGKIIDSLGEAHPAREALLVRLLEQAETVTLHYLSAHQQVLRELHTGNEPTALTTDHPATVDDSPAAPLLTVVQAARPAEPRAPLGYEQWLRKEIGATTGFAPDDLDLQQGFEQMGLDSLNRVDLYDALVKAFPEIRERAKGFFDLKTPAALLELLDIAAASPGPDVEARVMEHLAQITGFAAPDIDRQQSYESLGMDSLVRLDFLDLILADWPQLKAHGGALVGPQTPQATIDLLRQVLADSPSIAATTPIAVAVQNERQDLDGRLLDALAPLLGEGGKPLDIETPFSELGLDGFARESLCNNLAQHCASSAFAGEALMSRRSPREAAALLARMG